MKASTNIKFANIHGLLKSKQRVGISVVTEINNLKKL